MVHGTHLQNKKRHFKDEGALTPSIHFDAHIPLKKYQQNPQVYAKGKHGKKQSADKENERELKISQGWKTKKIEQPSPQTVNNQPCTNNYQS